MIGQLRAYFCVAVFLSRKHAESPTREVELKRQETYTFKFTILKFGIVWEFSQ